MEKTVIEVGTMAAGGLDPACLTHELRAPVTALKLGLQILEERARDRLSPSDRQTLEIALKSTGRLERLVNDVLDYARLTSGGLVVSKRPCDPRAAIDEVVGALQSVAVSRGIRLIKEAGPLLPRMNADPLRISQVLTNLISNALKFTPSGGRVLVSAGIGKFEHRGTIIFKVKDSGRGIPRGDLEKIFAPFVQSSRVGVGQGTGLGLTLSRMLVELHGGRIWAESWPGLGAAFSFTVPIFAADVIRGIPVYPKAPEYSGLLTSLARRLNAFLALFG